MSEVWGTVAVNDHKRTDAFIREVLLFDKLEVPVPATAKERERWKAPNDNDPSETWDPDHLDALLTILGTQRKPNKDKSPLVWVADWSEERWHSRRQVADDITQIDAFMISHTVQMDGSTSRRASRTRCESPRGLSSRGRCGHCPLASTIQRCLRRLRRLSTTTETDRCSESANPAQT